MGEAAGAGSERMAAVYPAPASALQRGRRRRRAGPRARHRTVPVTFAEIKEVDEEAPDADARAGSAPSVSSGRRPDLLDERLGAQLAESRRRRARRTLLREPDEAPGEARPDEAPGEARPDEAPGEARPDAGVS